MPSGSRSKEDTWKADDLESALRGKKDDHRRSEDRKRSDRDVRDRRKTDKDDDRDRKERKHREHTDPDRKERTRDKDRDRDREKGRDRDRDRHDREKGGREKERSERHRSKQEPENSDRERRRDDRKRSTVDKSGSRDKTIASQSNEDRHHRRPREDGERLSEDKERHRRIKDDEGRERKHRSHREREGEDGKSKRHRDSDVERKRSKDEQGDARKHRSHRDRDADKSKQRPSDKDSVTNTKSKPDVRKEQAKAVKPDKAPAEPKKEELTKDNDEYNYEDEEFEDYDDDFEDDDENEEASEKEEEPSNAAPDDSRPNNDMDELLSALDRENERLLHSAKNRGTTDRNDSTAHPAQIETDNSPSNRRTFINFSSAKKSQMSGVVASKARRRGNDLLKMIELDVAHYELFDMPPVNEYELYMRTFGCSNTRQAYVQTNDDNIECETQTDEMEYSDKWCQHPPADFNCTGGGEDTKESHEPERKPIDAVKLGKFLHKASQVITLLLEEEFSEISTRHGPVKNQSNIVLSESFVQLETSEITKDRHVAFSYFSPLQTKFLLTVYSKPHTIHQENRLSNSGLICVWNVGEPSQPEQVLVCESMPRCCCFSPGKATLVFAGMHDGSLVVWDLSEPSSLHRSHTIGDQEWLLRYPTYNTAGVLHHENHHSSVVQVTPIVATGDSAQASLNGVVGTGGGEGMSFQLATLEEQAVVNLWVVAEIMHPDPAGSESDLGLLPGGKVKLVKSSSIQLENPVRTPTLQTAMQALDLCLLPQNNSHFYVATDTGSIIHGVRYGGKAPPKAYHHQTEGLVRVTSLDFSPFCEPTFLAGCANGSLHLYMTESEYPLITWPDATENSAPVVWVRWCRSRPSVFFVLDSNAFLYIWDLLMDDLVPLKQEKVADARVTSFALSNDYSATGCGTPGRKPQMVMCLENGATEVHSISREFSAMMPDEINQFSQYLEKVV